MLIGLSRWINMLIGGGCVIVKCMCIHIDVTRCCLVCCVIIKLIDRLVGGWVV